MGNDSISKSSGRQHAEGLRFLVLLAVWTLLIGDTACAQSAYPSKPVRMIVPFAPGGPADLIARLVAQKLSEEFGKQFYVETHAGAGGNIGTGLAARAPADGYTLLVNEPGTRHQRAASTVRCPTIRTRTSSPSRASRHAQRAGRAPVGAGQDRQGTRRADAAAAGQVSRLRAARRSARRRNLSGELFRLSQKLDLTAIPFGGGGPMVQSVVGGPYADRILLAAAGGGADPGRHACARSRSPPRSAIDSLPDVPTMAEAGYPGQIGETPIGMLVPAGTPKEIVDLLHRKVVQIVAHARHEAEARGHRLRRRSATRRRSSRPISRPRSRKWGKVIRDGKHQAAVSLHDARRLQAPRNPQGRARSSRGSTSARKYGSSSA